MAKIAKKDKTENGVTFQFIDGESVEVSFKELSADIIHNLAIHGLSQKLGDSYASAESVDEARASLIAVWENLKSGEWNAKVSRGGKIVEAMVRATGETYDRCLEAFQKLDEAAKKELRKRPQIKLAMAEIEMERQTKLSEADSSGGKNLNDLF
jgi:hypothetical protein